MWMSKEQVALYPVFARYVRESMPGCSKVDRILRGLKMYGSLDETAARLALSWGHMPLVVVQDLWDDDKWEAEANGIFAPDKPLQIGIAEHRVNQFETPGAGGTDKNAAGKPVFIVGATLLHELCHWGMHHSGLSEKRETGRAFERYVYGKQIN